jgi:hypothetical protein
MITVWSKSLTHYRREKIGCETPRFLAESNRLCRMVAEDFIGCEKNTSHEYRDLRTNPVNDARPRSVPSYFCRPAQTRKPVPASIRPADSFRRPDPACVPARLGGCSDEDYCCGFHKEPGCLALVCGMERGGGRAARP